MLFFRHELGNKLLTFLTNLVTNLNLTDMETCYKAVRTDLLRSIPIVSNDFRLEPELTIKLAKREARIFEVPISYSGRTYQEGKKIGWRDGVQRAARHPPILARRRRLRARRARLADARGGWPRASRFNGWMADVIRPFLGSRLLEIGSGTGEPHPPPRPPRRLRGQRREPALREDAAATSPADRPYLAARYTDVTDLASYPRLEGGLRLGGLPERHRARRRRRGGAPQHPRRRSRRAGRRSCSSLTARGTSARSTRCSATAAATPRSLPAPGRRAGRARGERSSSASTGSPRCPGG